MLKRKIYIVATIAVFMILILRSPCFASLLNAELVLDGISLRSSIQDVVEKYGEPTSTQDFQWNNGYFGMYEYEGMYRVCFLKSNGIVWSIETWASNIATSAGITIGMTKEDVLGAYGNPNDQYYSNQGLEGYVYENSSGSHEMHFVFDHSGNIVEISIVNCL